MIRFACACSQELIAEVMGGKWEIAKRHSWCSKHWRAIYDAYMQSDRWRTISRLAVERSYGRCGGCYTRSDLSVHHRDPKYRSLGRESLEDLTVLCRTCHQKIHDISEFQSTFTAPYSDDDPHWYDRMVERHFVKLILGEGVSPPADAWDLSHAVTSLSPDDFVDERCARVMAARFAGGDIAQAPTTRRFAKYLRDRDTEPEREWMWYTRRHIPLLACHIRCNRINRQLEYFESMGRRNFTLSAISKLQAEMDEVLKETATLRDSRLSE